jgi:uncharacterized protein with HEPN domain
MLDYNVYIEQMLEMIYRMKKTNLRNLEKDDLTLDATIMRLQVLGESSSKIPDKMRKKYSHIDWKSLIKTRDFISHNYEIVDPVVVREFILNKILPLEENLKKMLKEENKK